MLIIISSCRLSIADCRSHIQNANIGIRFSYSIVMFTTYGHIHNISNIYFSFSTNMYQKKGRDISRARKKSSIIHALCSCERVFIFDFKNENMKTWRKNKTNINWSRVKKIGTNKDVSIKNTWNVEHWTWCYELSVTTVVNRYDGIDIHSKSHNRNGKFESGIIRIHKIWT